MQPARALHHMGRIAPAGARLDVQSDVAVPSPVIRLHRDAAYGHREADRVDVGWRLRRVRVVCSLCAASRWVYGLALARLAVFMCEL